VNYIKINKISKSILKRLEEIRQEDNYRDINELLEELIIIRDKLKLRAAQKLFKKKLRESNLDILDLINNDEFKVLSI
jgi:hypothetical protein